MGKPGTGYIRVSTTSQATEGVSPDAQRAAITRWCDSNGVVLEPGSVFVEGEGADKKSSKGLSGGRADNRPKLQAALDRVCETSGVLVVYSLSRLARSVKDTLAIAERLDKAGADLVSLSEKIDTTSASGRMMFRMLAVLAEFERDLISERTSTALTHKRGKGERIGQIPYGKSLGQDGLTLVANPEEEAALAVMVELAGRGSSLRSIARELDARRYRPKGGGERWSHSAVGGILDRVRESNEREEGEVHGEVESIERPS